MKKKKDSILILVLFCLLGINGNAQINLKEKLKDKVNDRANQRVDEGIDKGLDAIEDGVVNSVSNDESEQDDEETQDEPTRNTAKTSTTTKPKSFNSGSTNAAPITLKSATKYDFVPGDKVILYEDFSQDEVGDFPALWTTTGSGEVRTLNLYPGKWLYMNTRDKVYNLMKDMTLPDNYIFEFDVVPTPVEDDDDNSSFYFTLYNGSGEFMNDDLYPGTSGFHVTCNMNGWDVVGYKEGAGDMLDGNSQLAPLELNKLNHVTVWVQKRRLRIYHKGQKVVDLPTILYDGVKYNRLRFSIWNCDGLPYVSNLRFTTAKPDMRSKLLTEGKIVSYGIYFDVNSDKVKAESYGTLKEIAKVLTENPSVRIKIVGHTDGDGDAAKNLDLSKRRAASVKNELASNFGIAASRVDTDGKGKSEPISANDTPANKAKNRRVEFIKL